MKHYAPRGQPRCTASYWPSRSTESVRETTCKSCIRAINTDESLGLLLSDAQRYSAGRNGLPLAPFFVRGAGHGE